MNYEIVSLEQKTVVGVSAITSNNDLKMSEIIGGLWKDLYQNGVGASINNTLDEHAIGLYSDYAEDKYCVTVGYAVSKAENGGLAVKTIPAGRYAKFSVHGHMVNAVAAAWGEIWKTDLNRSFTADFEEYLNGDWENADIHIYIALK
jgi:predicted transcriptional regulator YdeE